MRARAHAASTPPLSHRLPPGVSDYTGVCSGKLMWGYLHQHTGAINGTLSLNGKPVCTSSAIYGTDPANPPGNEKGYVVNFTR